MAKITVAVIQLNVDDSDKESRIARAEHLLDQCQGAALIVLPELWNVGFWAVDKWHTQSESLNGETIQRLQKKATQLNATIMSGSIFEKNGNQLHNTSVLIAPDGAILGSYRKMHLYGCDSDEARLLTPGTTYGTLHSKIATVGLSTCFDLRFPELYRRQIDSGVELFLVAAAWPLERLEHWQILTRCRAIENQAFLIAANCAGVNRGHTYCGHSLIVDPTGKILAEAGTKEEILLAEINLEMVRVVRETFPSVSARVIK